MPSISDFTCSLSGSSESLARNSFSPETIMFVVRDADSLSWFHMPHGCINRCYCRRSSNQRYPNSHMSKNPNISNKIDSGRGYHKVATGVALTTVKQHETESDITLFGANFCPFVQRVWVAFEILGIPYQVSSLQGQDQWTIENDLLTSDFSSIV